MSEIKIWHLLAYRHRRCPICKAGAELNALLHQMITAGCKYKDLLDVLEAHGITRRKADYNLGRHIHHHMMPLLMEFLSMSKENVEPVVSAKSEVERLKLKVQSLKLARSRDELADATADALRELVTPSVLRKILKTMKEGSSDE